MRELAPEFQAYQWAPPTDEVAALAGIDRSQVLRFDQNTPPLPLPSTRPGTIAGALARDGGIILSVSDQGSGLTAAEEAQIWDRFVRGPRHAATTSASGLGLWIANAFIAANGGKVHALSEGPGLGTTISIELLVTQAIVQQIESDADE